MTLYCLKYIITKKQQDHAIAFVDLGYLEENYALTKGIFFDRLLHTQTPLSRVNLTSFSKKKNANVIHTF